MRTVTAVVAAVGASPCSAPDVLYAAPAGHGSACSSAAPCDLSTARDRVRGRLPQAAGNVVVELRGGTYSLTTPWRLGVQDSGTPGHRVVYRAAAGQTPVFSGAVKVTGFRKTDAAKNIYRASVPKGVASRELFVDGVRAPRARRIQGDSRCPARGSPPPTRLTRPGPTPPGSRSWPTTLENSCAARWRRSRPAPRVGRC